MRANRYLGHDFRFLLGLARNRVVMLLSFAFVGAALFFHSCGKKETKGSDGSDSVVSTGGWIKIDSGTTESLNDISFRNSNRVYVVGNSGTFLVSDDGGNTWKKHETFSSEADLTVISWVNEVVYVAGQDSVFVSKDGGNSFQDIGEAVEGRILDMTYNTGAFWAVGEKGIVWKGTIDGDLESFDPLKTKWEKVDLGIIADLNGLSFSFSRGLIVGDGGTVLETTDGGKTFENVGKTTDDLKTIDSDVFAGPQSLFYYGGIDGAPAYAVKWITRKNSAYPNFVDIDCIVDCLALGESGDGSTILLISDLNPADSNKKGGEILETLVKGVKPQLNALAAHKKIAVGKKGLIVRAAE